MRSRFLPVGAQFELNGHTYEIVEQFEKEDLCKGCAFFLGGMVCNSPQLTPMCIKYYRKDNKSVIFKKIK